ncbi:MAG: molybdopterin molybdotransferase MoeA, partial [Moorella sp. (in: Bacteria)]|nr:molybdopterin molybdotransferase MoeA [Moorella sp. (in: firmicutes)]
PQDIGALAGTGITRVPVAKKPKVAVISTGDEIVPPGYKLKPGQTRDINSYTLSALVKQAGGEPVTFGIIHDSFDKLKAALDRALDSTDMVLISGGSSVGHRDVTAKVIAGAGSPGVLIHGVSVKPGKPVVAGVAAGKPVLGMPGHPVSAMVIFYLLARRLIERKLGLVPRFTGGFGSITARMARNVASVAGREDYIRVALKLQDGELVAEPVLGKSALISTMTGADGMVRIPPEREGVLQSDMVQVVLF